MSEFENENKQPEEQTDGTGNLNSAPEESVQDENSAVSENAESTANTEENTQAPEQTEIVDNSVSGNNEQPEPAKCCCGCGDAHDSEENHECSCGCGCGGKHGGKKGWLIAFCIIAVLAIAAFFSYDAILLRVNPTEYLINASNRTLKETLCNLPDFVKSFAESTQDGTINLKIDTTELAKLNEQTKLDVPSLKADASYTANAQDSASALSGNFSSDGVGFDFSIVNDGQKMSLASDKFTDGNYYGFEFATFEEKFANSVFAPDSSSDFSMDSETYNTVLDMFKDNDLTEFDFDEYMEKSTELTRNYFKNIKPEISKEKISVDDKEVKATAIKYVLNQEQTNEFMNMSFDLADELGFLKVFSAKGLEQLKESYTDFYKEMTIIYYIKGGYIVRENLAATMNGAYAGSEQDLAMTADFVLGLKPFKDGQISFLTETNSADLTVKTSFVSHNEENKYTAKIESSSSDGYSSVTDYIFDRDTNKFSITSVSGNSAEQDGASNESENGTQSNSNPLIQPREVSGTELIQQAKLPDGASVFDDTTTLTDSSDNEEQTKIVVLNGAVEEIEDGYKISVSNISNRLLSSSENSEPYPLEISVSCSPANNIEAPEKVKNILDMSEDELYSLFYGILYKFYSLSSEA